MSHTRCATKISSPRVCRRPRGFGFVEFLDARDADDAVRDMDGRTFGGREISVVLSQEKRKTPREMAHRDDCTWRWCGWGVTGCIPVFE